MTIVRCNGCGWIGTEEELHVTFPLALFGRDFVKYCPACEESGKLQDLNSDMPYDDEELRKLWEIFGDTPCDDQDGIDEPFMDWPQGTPRLDIWYWFDEQYSKGVKQLMDDVNEEMRERRMPK